MSVARAPIELLFDSTVVRLGVGWPKFFIQKLRLLT